MIKTKLIPSLILTIVFGFLSVVSVNAQSSNFTLEFNPEIIDATVGEVVTADIFVVNATDVNYAEIKLSLANDDLEFTAIEEDSEMLAVNTLVTPNLVTMDVGKIQAYFSENQKLATVSIKVNKISNSQISLKSAVTVGGEVSNTDSKLTITVTDTDGSKASNEPNDVTNYDTEKENFTKTDLPESTNQTTSESSVFSGNTGLLLVLIISLLGIIIVLTLIFWLLKGRNNDQSKVGNFVNSEALVAKTTTPSTTSNEANQSLSSIVGEVDSSNTQNNNII